ncbi:restless-like transposase [Apiospora marii]|uniref:restless-like transposase n=1 Tax=Apiospora marii TaxID=335849 RepID=UPI00312F0221
MESFIQAESAIPITNDQHHAELFERFRGWTFAERVREVTSWIWDFGFDIQRIVNRDTTERRWICKLCIIQRRPSIKPITDSGLQNAAGHLYTHHRILAPDGKTKSREEKLSSGTSNRARSIAYFMHLNPEKPSEQAAINKAIQSFDRKRFQRLLVEWIVVVDLIEEFGVGDKTGYFVMDNAANNDTAMDFIGHKYGFDGRGRRERCFGHILNLSAKLLLFGNEQQSVNSFVETPDQLTEAEYDLWRKEGPVGKLRILVIAIDSSDRLTDLFARLQANDISTAQTVSYQREWEAENRSRALGSNSLRRSAKLPAFLEERNWLTPNDWAVTEHLERILTDYEHTLLRLEGDGQIRRRTGGFEGSYGNVWDVLPAFEFLLGRLECYKAVASDVPDPIQFKVGVNAAWDKLNYYYSKLDETPIYYAAFALHPAKRWQGLEKMWESQNISWITAAKKIVKDVWLEQYRGRAIRPDSHSPTPTPEPSSKRRKVNNFERFLNSNTSIPASPTDHFNGLDEYDIWMAAIDEDDQYVEDAIAYWHSQRRRYPRLSQMALDLVTIQAMSAECERLFSAAGNLLDHSRSSLDIKLVGCGRPDVTIYKKNKKNVLQGG